MVACKWFEKQNVVTMKRIKNTEEPWVDMPKSAARKLSATDRPNSPRLTREQWLERGLRLLEQQGPGVMNVETLTRHMGVTTGSFYWHFKNHYAFLEALMEIWAQETTYDVVNSLETVDDLPPEEKLREVMSHVIGAGLSGLDISFRGLAMNYPKLGKKIREIDAYRSGVITDLFEAAGYSGDALQMRVHAFLVLSALESGVQTPLAPEDRLRLLDERMRLLLAD